MIGFISDEVASSPFAGRLLKGAQLLAWETGNVILSVDTFNEPDLEAAAIDMMLSYRVKGVVYASMYHRMVDVPVGLEAIPTVVVNAQDRAGRVPSVFPDEELGGYAATRQLIDAGHTRIAMINIQSPESELPAGIGRLAGYRRALAEAGISGRSPSGAQWIGHRRGRSRAHARTPRRRAIGRPRSSAETIAPHGARTERSSPWGCA